MTQPLVSIIIPTFNRAHLIGETLDSILAQTYTHWECIVVDDGSTDETEALMMTYVTKDARFQYYQRPISHLPGGNGARNYGFKISNGEYIQWFDSDDLMHPNKLCKQINVLESSIKMFSVCQTQQFSVDINQLLGLRSKQIYSNNPAVSFIKGEIVFLTQAPIFKREFLIKHKLFFDENLKAAQEWEFFSRCLLVINDYEVENMALVYLRRHDKSITSSSVDNDLRWFYYLARLKIFSYVSETNQRDILNNYFQFYFQRAFFKFIDNKEYLRAKHCLIHAIKNCYSKYEYIQAIFYFTLSEKVGEFYCLRKNILKSEK
ncbi:glycosyltransferase family 2 protein [Gelidibacter sp. F2691]|nr:glycosyltransferase family 2 protein [Gelidibacter sp. F2691]